MFSPLAVRPCSAKVGHGRSRRLDLLKLIIPLAIISCTSPLSIRRQSIRQSACFVYTSDGGFRSNASLLAGSFHRRMMNTKKTASSKKMTNSVLRLRMWGKLRENGNRQTRIGNQRDFSSIGRLLILERKPCFCN